MKKLWCLRGLPRLSGVAASFLVMSLAVPVASASTALYVDQASSSCSNSGPGSQAVPFCSIQSAANVVDPGQTVYIETAPGSQNYDENVTITRSGTPSAPITFARLGTELLPDVDPYTNGGVPITLRNVHDVRLYFLAVDHRNGQNGIEVTGSSDITLDRVRDAYDSANTLTSAGVTVDGASSDVTISRAEISGGDGYGVQVQPGALRVTVTTSEIVMENGTGIALNDAASGAVTSNTMWVPDCGAGVGITGGSSAVAENNIIDMWGKVACAPPAAALSVDQDSAGTVRADYNAVFVRGSSTRYSWAGTSYADAAAFNAATGQGAHDLGLTSAIQGNVPPAGSPVIDSADCTAPGELSTDFQANPRVRDPLVTDTGVGTCYADRGAFELQDSLNPAPSAITPTSLQGPVPFNLTVTLNAPAKSGWGEPVSYTIDFGDGSGPVLVASASTTSHTYTTAGQYTLTMTAADTGGSTVTYQRQVVAET